MRRDKLIFQFLYGEGQQTSPYTPSRLSPSLFLTNIMASSAISNITQPNANTTPHHTWGPDNGPLRAGQTSRQPNRARVHYIKATDLYLPANYDEGGTSIEDFADTFYNGIHEYADLRFFSLLLKILRNRNADLRHGDIIQLQWMDYYRNDGTAIFDQTHNSIIGLQLAKQLGPTRVGLQEEPDDYGSQPNFFCVGPEFPPKYWSEAIRHDPLVWVAESWVPTLIANVQSGTLAEFPLSLKPSDPSERNDVTPRRDTYVWSSIQHGDQTFYVVGESFNDEPMTTAQFKRALEVYASDFLSRHYHTAFRWMSLDEMKEFDPVDPEAPIIYMTFWSQQEESDSESEIPEGMRTKGEKYNNKMDARNVDK